LGCWHATPRALYRSCLPDLLYRLYHVTVPLLQYAGGFGLGFERILAKPHPSLYSSGYAVTVCFAFPAGSSTLRTPAFRLNASWISPLKFLTRAFWTSTKSPSEISLIWLFHTAKGICPVPSERVIEQTRRGVPSRVVTALTSDFLTTCALKERPPCPTRNCPISLVRDDPNDSLRPSGSRRVEYSAGSFLSFLMEEVLMVAWAKGSSSTENIYVDDISPRKRVSILRPLHWALPRRSAATRES